MPSPPRRCLAVCLPAALFTLLTTPCLAQLTFESYRQELAAVPGAEVVEVSFAFANTSDTPIIITRVETSCGCTDAEAPSGAIAPVGPPSDGNEAVSDAASPTIVVRFTLGDRQGRQTKRIILSTDHPRQPRITLTLVVDIPVVFNARPAALIWREDDPREAKATVLTVLDHEDVEFLGLGEAVEGVAVEIGEGAAGKENEPGVYTLRVTPGADLAAGTYTVPVRVWVGDAEQAFTVAVRVMGDPREAAPTP